MSTLPEVTSKFIDSIKDFIYRDIMYVIGGLSIILASQYCFRIPKFGLDTTTIIYICCLAYIIGYAIQEFFSILGFVTTGQRKPGKTCMFFAKRFSPFEKWDSIHKLENVNLGKLRNCVDNHSSEETRKRISRTINLKHVAASGASFLMVSLILFYDVIFNYSAPYVFPMACITLSLSLILMLMSRIKTAQQMIMELNVHQSCPKCGIEKSTEVTFNDCVHN